MSLTTSIHTLDDVGIEDRWAALSGRTPHRSPFSTISFLRASATATKGLRSHVHFVREEGRDVAGCVMHWRRRGPYAEVVVPAFTPFSGILLGAEPSESDVHGRKTSFERLLESMEGAYDVVRLHLPPGLDDVRPALWRGWNVRPQYTYARSLEPSSNPTEGWSSGTARTFRKHRKAYEVLDPGTAACVSLCGESYARHGRRLPLPADRLHRLIEQLSIEGSVVRFGARGRSSGAIEAAVAILRDDRSAYYWVAGSTPGPAMTVLVGAFLPVLASQGIGRFDFMGANTPSIAEFKRRFGCRLLRYQRLALFTRKELRLLHALKRILH